MKINIQFPDFVPPWLQILLAIAIFFVFSGLWIGTSIWAIQDANTRGKAGCLIGLLVFLTWPLGLLFWAVARPPTKVILPDQKNSERPG